MSLIKSFLALILAITIAGIAILNRNSVDITWSPVHPSYSIPLYAVILGALACGFLIGGTAVWSNHGKVRKTRRQQKKQIKTLEKELTKNEATTGGNAPPPSDFFPALPTAKD